MIPMPVDKSAAEGKRQDSEKGVKGEGKGGAKQRQTSQSIPRKRKQKSVQLASVCLSRLDVCVRGMRAES